MEFLTILIVVGAVGSIAGSGYVTLLVGRSLVTDLLANRAPLPGWLEAIAPLKGRWLRLFLTAPMLALLLVLVFSAVLYILVMFLMIVATILGFLGSSLINALGAR